MQKNTKETVDKQEVRYSKKQILNSKKYIGRKDMLNAVLEPEKEYTTVEITEKIEQIMKGKVE